METQRSTGMFKTKDYTIKKLRLVKKRGLRKPKYKLVYPNIRHRISFTLVELDAHKSNMLRKKIAKHQEHQERVTLKTTKYKTQNFN